MDRLTAFSICAAIAVVPGCGKNPGEPELTWAKVAGTYSGPVSGSGAYGELTGTLELTLTQDEERLGGTYVMAGTVIAPISPGPVTVTGTLVGYLAYKGEEPFLTLSLYEPNCGTRGYTGYGGYLSSTREVHLHSATFLVCGVSDREFGVLDAVLVRQ